MGFLLKWCRRRNFLFFIRGIDISLLMAGMRFFSQKSWSVLFLYFFCVLKVFSFLIRIRRFQMILLILMAFTFAGLVRCFSFFNLFLGISSASSFVSSTFPFWVLWCQFGWVLSNKFDVVVNWNSLVLLDIDEKLLGMRSDLSTRTWTNVFFNSLPVLTVISKTYINKSIDKIRFR